MPGETELEMVQRHIADGEKKIEAQKARVKELGAGGGDSKMALSVLTNFMEMQNLHLAHLARLQN